MTYLLQAEVQLEDELLHSSLQLHFLLYTCTVHYRSPKQSISCCTPVLSPFGQLNKAFLAVHLYCPLAVT